MTADAEEGSTLPLILVFLAVAAGFAVVAAAATSLHLERLRLLTVADGAALAAAESFRVAEARVEAGGVVPVLRDEEVRAVAADYLGAADTAGLADLRLEEARTPDGTSALVRLTATWRPPIAGPLLPLALPVTVTSSAAARFR
ncbi:MAG: pilus assembly protein TadG-related protein [Amnibacterium sp.]